MRTAVSVAALLLATWPAWAQTKQAPPAPAPAQPAARASQSQPAAPRQAVEVVARVGDSEVTADDVRAAVAQLDARQQAAVIRDPALLNQAVRGILANRLVLKEALTKKWDQRESVMAQLARLRERLLVESYLDMVSAPPENYPNDAEIKAVYESNLGAFLVPRRFRVAQIFVALAKDADKAAEDAARKKLDDAQKRIKQPNADFAAIARATSDDAASVQRDGEVGWIAEPDLRSEVRNQIIGLQKSGISDTIKLEDGWHIFKLLDTEASQTRPLADVKESLAQRMRAERAEGNRRSYLVELLRQTPPAVNELAIAKLFDTKDAAKADGAKSESAK